MGVQRRADRAWVELVEFVDIGGELPAPRLSAHGSEVATRESVRIPDWLREVNGHRDDRSGSRRRSGRPKGAPQACLAEPNRQLTDLIQSP